MESQSLEEDNIIKNVRNFFRFKKLKRETAHTTIKGIRNLFRIENKQLNSEYLEILERFSD